jgi:hypothetical protein
MPWRNAPPAAAPGSPSRRERLPRAIAARLKSAGYLTEIPVTGEAANAAGPQDDDEGPTGLEDQPHRDKSPDK